MFALGPQYYSHIYYVLVAVLSVAVFRQYAIYQKTRFYENGRTSLAGFFILTLFLVLFIGLRPVSEMYFVDMEAYSSYYALRLGDPFDFNWSTDNIIFDNYLLFLSSRGIPQEVFFLSIALIYFGCMAWACACLFPRDKMAAFLVCLGALSAFSYATNGIKAGAAASIFLVAIAMYERRKLLWTILFALLSLGFHHSMIVPIAAFIICHFVKNPKFYYAIWVFSFVVALLHISFFQQLFAGLADEQGASYLLGEGEHIRHDILGGFRIDFILYSAVPILIGWIATTKKRIQSKPYNFVLNLYILTNSIWILCMYAEFTNRIAYLSWFMLPIVIIYPFLKEEWGPSQYHTFHWVALGHLGFTLFMQYIYY